VPNVYLDTSGSVIDAGMIEMAAAELGTERLLFGTDMTMEGGVGKILGAELTDEGREQIFYRNMQGILERRRGA
jgi:predicted TIM-barrel fold metal-dependent hydrolase